MTLRIDYLNSEREPRHIFTDTNNIWFELETIFKQWATDVFIYNLIKDEQTTN
jgi:hypothetical protein